MKKHSILVVDDTPENIDVLVGVLGDTYGIKVARAGEQALRIADSAEPPDLILLDVVMPGMSGYEVCEKLKSRKRTRGIPVIFITGLAELASMVKGFELGGVDYIIKPFNAVELITRVGTHLKLKDANEILKNQNVILEQLVEKRTKSLQKKNELLKTALHEKDSLLREVRSMEAKLRESLDMLNRLYDRIQNIQEEERRKIAADVHDQMGQLLTAVKLNLFQLRGWSGTGDDKIRGKVEQTIGLVDDAVKSAQGISMRLRPDILDNLGFIEAVKWFCRVLVESSGVTFELEDDGQTLVLDKEKELCLYRVIQEAFTNVVRHARAQKCRISIGRDAAALRIVIHDDGVGIDKDRINAVNSLGIYGMRKRLDDINAELRIEGDPGKGTTLSIRVPLNGVPRD